MKVFWSWQSDTPGKIGRHFVRGALLKALEELKQDPEIQEPSERDDSTQGLHLDQDIQGTTGSPNLVETILSKIEASVTFMADVTCVGRVVGNGDEEQPTKRLINSNVAIELGYALKSLTDARVFLVFNSHYGSHVDVPLDLRHKGGAIIFRLAPDADHEAIKLEESKLRGMFLRALRPLLREAKQGLRPSFVETPTTYSKATYFDEGAVIAEYGSAQFDEELKYSYRERALIYMRLIPQRTLPSRFSVSDLLGAIASAPVLTAKQIGGLDLTARNQFGAIKWNPGSNPPRGAAQIESSTQLFRNGEVWSIGVAPIRKKQEQFGPLPLKFPFIQYEIFERTFQATAPNLLKFFEGRLGLTGPLYVVCGATGLKNSHLTPYKNYSQIGPFYEDEQEVRLEEKPKQICRKRFSHFSKNCGTRLARGGQNNSTASLQPRTNSWLSKMGDWGGDRSPRSQPDASLRVRSEHQSRWTLIPSLSPSTSPAALSRDTGYSLRGCAQLGLPADGGTVYVKSPTRNKGRAIHPQPVIRRSKSAEAEFCCVSDQESLTPRPPGALHKTTRPFLLAYS